MSAMGNQHAIDERFPFITISDDHLTSLGTKVEKLKLPTILSLIHI